MVVMLIFVLMSAVVVVSMSPALSDARLRSGARMIVSMLNYARSYAVAHQTEARVVFDRTENGIVVETKALDERDEEQVVVLTTSAGKYHKLPGGLQIEPVEKTGSDEEQEYISFSRIGQAENASVTITDSKGRQRRITVDGITGRCVVESDADASSKTGIPNTR